MNLRTSPHAFTLVEMLTVMAVIAVLASIILSLNGLVQRKAATSRAEGEIAAMSAACESYKADFGSYPQDPTDSPATEDSTLATRTPTRARPSRQDTMRARWPSSPPRRAPQAWCSTVSTL